MVVLPGVDLTDAVARAETARARIEALMPGGIKATISIGVATLGHGDGYDELFQRADGAMYHAKLAGRNRVKMTA